MEYSFSTGCVLLFHSHSYLYAMFIHFRAIDIIWLKKKHLLSRSYFSFTLLLFNFNFLIRNYGKMQPKSSMAFFFHWEI